MGHTQPYTRQSFITSQIDNNSNHPIARTHPAFMAKTNFHPAALSQEALASHFLDPLLQAPTFNENPISSVGLNMSDELIELWANLPLSFRCVIFDSYLMLYNIDNLV
jgi:hypothetical protein